MNRRDFLISAGSVSGGAVAAGAAAPAAAQEEETTTSGPGTTEGPSDGTTGNGTDGAEGTGTNGTTQGGDGGGGGGASEEVVVGPGGDLVFEPSDLTIAPGTTVNFVWDSDNHNVVPDSIPDDAEWEGTEGGEGTTYDDGHEYSHTFEVTGTYEYYCAPHLSAGMEGTITVQEGGAAEGGGELEPHEMGVPFQAHFVGAATMLAIFVSLVFTFYLLKYGESPNASSPNRD